MEYKTYSDMDVVRRHVQKTTRHVLLRGRHPYEFVKDLQKIQGRQVTMLECYY